MRLTTDLPTFVRIDRFFDPATPLDDLLAALTDDNWQIQQAALQALGQRPDVRAVPAIVALLDRQDALPLYGAPDQWSLDGAPDADTKEIWRCRFRVKQAACHALGAIGAAHGAAALGAKALERLATYATSQKDDYCTRAAACQSLGRCRAAAARPALELAAQDGEWCTKTEAGKALAALG
jgi:HEAT repeat protein